MAFIREYEEGEYEIVQYTGGGTIRERITGKIIASYTDYWCKDGVHPETQEEVDFINKKLGLNIKV